MTDQMTLASQPRRPGETLAEAAVRVATDAIYEARDRKDMGTMQDAGMLCAQRVLGLIDFDRAGYALWLDDCKRQTSLDPAKVWPRVREEYVRKATLIILGDEPVPGYVDLGNQKHEEEEA